MGNGEWGTGNGEWGMGNGERAETKNSFLELELITRTKKAKPFIRRGTMHG